MTRIIAIVVVIAAAVIAYMYTSAGDVELGEVPTSTEPLGEGAVVDAEVADEAVVVAEPTEGEEAVVVAEPAEEDLVAPEVIVEEDAEVPAAELEEGLVEEDPAALVEGDEAGLIDGDADVVAETSETLPSEEGPSDGEPELGVGAVSTEEETDGAGAAGITAEEDSQDGTIAAEGTLAEEVLTEEVPVEEVVTEEVAIEEAPVEEVVVEEVVIEEAPVEDVVTEEVVTEEAAPAEGAAVTAVEPAIIEDSSVVEESTAVIEDSAVVAEPAATGDAVVRNPGPALRATADPVVADPATPADLDALLDPATLDVPAVVAAIEASDLEPALKAQLTQAVTVAQNSPGLLPDVLTRIRLALEGE